MDLSVVFATPVGIEKHPELAKKAEALFECKDLFKLARNGDVGAFWTTLNGYGKKNVSTMPDLPVVDDIKQAIAAGAKTFMGGFGYDVEKYDFEVANLWMNRMKSGSVHTAHSHYGHHISGCFYVTAPENGNKVLFYGPRHNAHKPPVEVVDYNIFSADHYTVGVSAGDMVFWESYLRHEVPASEFEGLRLSMAFDVNMTYKE